MRSLAKNVSRLVNVNGYGNDLDIASEFAVHFTKVFDSSHDDSAACNEYLNKRLECMRNGLQSSYECIDLVDRRLCTGEQCTPMFSVKYSRQLVADCLQELHFLVQQFELNPTRCSA